MSPHAAKSLIRRTLAVALCAVAAPAAAHADVSVDRGKLTYTAGADANHVVVSATGATVHLTDSVPVPAGRGCSASGATVSCTGVTNLRINAGEGDNFVDTRAAALPAVVTAGNGADRIYTGGVSDSLTAGAGADWIDGGAGADLFSAGDGDDVVIARDGARDWVGCGGGADSGTDDGNDYTAPDCEALGETPPADPPGGSGEPVGSDPADPTDPGGATNPSDPPAGDPPSGGDPGSTDVPVGGGLTGPLNLEPPVVFAQTAPVENGVAQVRIGCPADAGGCKGTVELFLVKRHGMVTAARKPARIGHAKFSARAGAKPTVRVRLDRRGRRRVIRRRKVRVRVVVTTRTATGEVIRTSRRITLKARR